MPWRLGSVIQLARRGGSRNRSRKGIIRKSSTAQSTVRFQRVPELQSWDVAEFRQKVFSQETPARLPWTQTTLLAACERWFIHDKNTSSDDEVASLNESFWRPYADLRVPLEFTGLSPDDSKTRTFQRNEAPLALLLDYLRQTTSSHYSIYLAQWPISSLPTAMRTDLPTPTLVLEAGKGDIYDSSVWLGAAPTNTPLHRDPNPNLLLQLAGRKTIRLFPPQVGHVIFEMVQERLRTHSSAVFRGEEMMVGPEHELLDRFVWSGENEDEEVVALQRNGYQTTISTGEAVFVPKGWWHSVKGVGAGVVASANWWFR